MSVTGFSSLESRVVTNVGHCLTLIHGTVQSWQEKRGEPLPIRAVLAVLPITCHARSVNALTGKLKISALVQAVGESPDWSRGFCHRVVRYSPVCYRSLAVGHSLGLIAVEPAGLVSVRSLVKKIAEYDLPHSSHQYVALDPYHALRVARLLGRLFADIGVQQCLSVLGWKDLK